MAGEKSGGVETVGKWRGGNSKGKLSSANYRQWEKQRGDNCGLRTEEGRGKERIEEIQWRR